MNKFSIMILATCLLSACGYGGAESLAPGNAHANNASSPTAGAVEARAGIPMLDRGDTLVGTDRNSNGVRDDIEDYINSLPDKVSQKNALRQTGMAFTAVLSTNVGNSADLSANSAKLSNASSCLFSRYPSALANKRAREMEKFHINTKQRFDAYDAYNRALSGSTSASPMGSGCLD